MTITITRIHFTITRIHLTITNFRKIHLTITNFRRIHFKITHLEEEEQEAAPRAAGRPAGGVARRAARRPAEPRTPPGPARRREGLAPTRHRAMLAAGMPPVACLRRGGGRERLR